MSLNQLSPIAQAELETGTTTRPPKLKGAEDFSTWKTRIQSFFEYTDYNLWLSVTAGPHIPTVVRGDAVVANNGATTFTNEDKALIQRDRRAHAALTMALSTDDCNMVENVMFKIAKARERRRQDLGIVKFIKGEDGSVLFNEHDIKLRWKTYFHYLFNNGRDYQQVNGNSTTQRRQRNNCYCRCISEGEVKIAPRKMGRAKAVGPDNIPIEVWKCLENEGVQWLTNLFNLIFKSGRMPDQWRSSVVVPL
ncbi:uncharacterized protein LOC110893056 [Helianthus annuus]|uniref:uncharacterized protein LOC110893056 n=1 Tax=Helianthus annuus TaxID=4232 RepID=UPI000B902359|nr:uncharacterized protein LOC110893056 [Helianthus annuus]